MEKYKGRNGLVFLCHGQVSGDSIDKFESVMIEKGIVDEPFEFKESSGNANFFVCKEGATCKSAALLEMISSDMQLSFLHGNLFKIDALQAFLNDI